MTQIHPDQLNLLAEPRARATDPATSVAAAARVKPGNQARLLRIAEIVDESGARGATSDEIWQRFCLDDPYWLPRKSTVHGAVSRTISAGLIQPKGPKLTRLSVLSEPQQILVTERWKP